ncbi:FAD-dependent oxidoreductase, partial [Pedobacter sp.]|uniref:FAD-dependent oxidoreductase n=1 Tax=Pedobacter sp. TaxID=1411316 RepID=UPI003D7F95EF
DFDLLPRFHHQNVAVIGDAAHLALPFTSAGTTNAMVDAKTLADMLLMVQQDNLPLADAFEGFYAERSLEVAQHLAFGRNLRDVFLNPAAYEGKTQEVPLIA